MTSKHWLAIGVLGAGGVGLLSTFLYAKGRQHEAFALSVAATITSTVFAAARILSEPELPPCEIERNGPDDYNVLSPGACTVIMPAAAER